MAVMEVPGAVTEYTTHMFTIQAKCRPGVAEETRGTYRVAAAATLRFPHGGDKITFEIPIHAKRLSVIVVFPLVGSGVFHTLDSAEVLEVFSSPSRRVARSHSLKPPHIHAPGIQHEPSL